MHGHLVEELLCPVIRLFLEQHPDVGVLVLYLMAEDPELLSALAVCLQRFEPALHQMLLHLETLPAGKLIQDHERRSIDNKICHLAIDAGQYAFERAHGIGHDAEIRAQDQYRTLGQPRCTDRKEGNDGRPGHIPLIERHMALHQEDEEPYRSKVDKRYARSEPYPALHDGIGRFGNRKRIEP